MLFEFMQDITQRKDMEEQQRRAEKLQAAATSAAVVKRDFLAFIGHECRNPLNALFNVTDFSWMTLGISHSLFIYYFVCYSYNLIY